ncbi:hypothetical protein AMTRI_Chr02g258650 [Amborella trichopoda]
MASSEKTGGSSSTCVSSSQAHAALRQGLKELVRGHLHETCITTTTFSNSENLEIPLDGSHSRKRNRHHRLKAAWDSNEGWVSESEDDSSTNSPHNLNYNQNHNRNRNENQEEKYVPSSSPVSRRQSRLLDRWAARQAREMITTIERQALESELTALSGTNSVSSRASSFLRESSPAQSECSSVVEPPNLRASSLVQMWRELEAEARANQSPRTHRRSEPSNPSSPRYGYGHFWPQQGRGVENQALSSDDAFGEWESDVGASSNEPDTSSMFILEESGESEKGGRRRVADIIQRLSSFNDREQCSREVSVEWSMCLTDHQEGVNVGFHQPEGGVQMRWGERGGEGELRGGENVVGQLGFGRSNPPRIRGRQATVDLLMRLVRERQRELTGLLERRPVSGFSHRNRIQTTLKGRFLHHRLAAHDQRPPQPPAAVEIEYLQLGTSISRLRERFAPGAPTTERTDHVADQSSRSKREPPDNSSSSSNNSNNDSSSSSSSSNISINNNGNSSSSNNKNDNNNNNDNRSSSAFGNNNNNENNNNEITTLGSIHSLTCLASSSNHLLDPEVATGEAADGIAAQQLLLTPVQSQNEDLQTSDSLLRETRLQISDSEWQGNEYAETLLEWQEGDVSEEPHADDLQDQQIEDVDQHPWEMAESSFSHQIWEVHSQNLHYDWPENHLHNVELRELQERRSVSNALASDFRVTMDQLILSHLERQEDEPNNESIEDQEHIQHQSDSDFDQIASTSFSLPLPTRLLRQLEGPSHSAFTCSNHSIELDLIYDLRAEMAHLQHGMHELQKMIESCIEMQVELQRSVRQELSAALNHSSKAHEGIREETSMGSKRGTVKKGVCCVCYEVQVDTLLYRCGHMCTCLKCANELQWNSGRCPICRAPIVDVVRAYTDN